MNTSKITISGTEYYRAEFLFERTGKEPITYGAFGDTEKEALHYLKRMLKLAGIKI
jgi:hypothetical protein